MDCDAFSGVSAELALGVLTGRPRAEALAHAETCSACREALRQLTVTGEELLPLLPAAEPPPGFETRVLARIGVEVPGLPQRRRGRRFRLPAFRLPRYQRLLAPAAVVAVLGAGLGGWGIGAASVPAAAPASPSAPTPKPSLSSAPLVTAGRQEPAGQVYYYGGGQSRWMYMSVDLDSGTTTVTCQLRGADGHYTTLGRFRLNGGYGYWASPVASGPVTGARLVTPGGTVLAAATFPR